MGRRFADDPAAQIHFERYARRHHLPYKRTCDGRALRYRFPIDVPIHDDERLATIEFAAGAQPRVSIDGPPCLRHRFSDKTLCMWFHSDPPEQRWLLIDGLLELARHVEEHAYCEAECRAGRSWPKPEAPGDHPRPPSCPTCHGQCSSR